MQKEKTFDEKRSMKLKIKREQDDFLKTRSQTVDILTVSFILIQNTFRNTYTVGIELEKSIQEDTVRKSEELKVYEAELRMKLDQAKKENSILLEKLKL